MGVKFRSLTGLSPFWPLKMRLLDDADGMSVDMTRNLLNVKSQAVLTICERFYSTLKTTDILCARFRWGLTRFSTDQWGSRDVHQTGLYFNAVNALQGTSTPVRVDLWPTDDVVINVE